MVVAWVTYAISFVLIRMISRYREYAADRGSAIITGAPEYLMSALQKIRSDGRCVGDLRNQLRADQDDLALPRICGRPGLRDHHRRARVSDERAAEDPI